MRTTSKLILLTHCQGVSQGQQTQALLLPIYGFCTEYGQKEHFHLLS